MDTTDALPRVSASRDGDRPFISNSGSGRTTATMASASRSSLRPGPLGIRAAARRLRRIVAIAVASLARRAVPLIGHGGTSLPGMLADRIDPTVVTALAADLGTTVFVVGTNGKTTTSRLVARLLGAVDGATPLANRSGANLKQGIASSLVAEASPFGRLRRPGRTAVFEVDELALGAVVRKVTPTMIVILNLFRDQLDRFGEVETVIDRWRRDLGTLPASTVLVSCADDPRVEALVAASRLAVVRFGLTGPPSTDTADRGEGTGAPHDAGTADPVACPVCGTALAFGWRSIGHLGDWACPAGHVRRVVPDVRVRSLTSDLTGSSIHEFEGGFGLLRSRIHLAGTAAAYNAAAAVTAAIAAGDTPASAIAALDGATPAFGRFEEARYSGRRIVLSLAKNPASLAESAQVAASLHPDGILVGLSDEPADGTDVSWIWDVDFAPLRTIPAMGLTGTRHHDLAVRLKYAADGGSWPIVLRIASAEQALQRMIGSIRPGGTLAVVATYTSMLAVRAALERRGAVSPMPR